MKTNKTKEKTLKICVGHHNTQDEDKRKTTTKTHNTCLIITIRKLNRSLHSRSKNI